MHHHFPLCCLSRIKVGERRELVTHEMSVYYHYEQIGFPRKCRRLNFSHCSPIFFSWWWQIRCYRKWEGREEALSGTVVEEVLTTSRINRLTKVSLRLPFKQGQWHTVSLGPQSGLHFTTAAVINTMQVNTFFDLSRNVVFKKYCFK